MFLDVLETAFSISVEVLAVLEEDVAMMEMEMEMEIKTRIATTRKLHLPAPTSSAAGVRAP